MCRWGYSRVIRKAVGRNQSPNQTGTGNNLKLELKSTRASFLPDCDSPNSALRIFVGYQARMLKDFSPEWF